MNNKEITKQITLNEAKSSGGLFGTVDRNLNAIEKKFAVRIVGRGETFSISGSSKGVAVCERILSQLNSLVQKGITLENGDFLSILRLFERDSKSDIVQFFASSNRIETDKKVVQPKGLHQREYIHAMEDSDLVFGIGPAGTGKTYLAMAKGVSYLIKKKVSRIILTRPAVEAGEKLGFLPGDIAEKVNPYLRPLYDALYDMVEMDKALSLIEQGVIEMAPLAFMRGRTLNDAFIILDEAQNCTCEQMKMFLTRLGFNSKATVTGDITQIDLQGGQKSGLIEALEILPPIPSIRFIRFTEKDVVRHQLVQDIIQAYDKNGAERVESSPSGKEKR